MEIPVRAASDDEAGLFQEHGWAVRPPNAETPEKLLAEGPEVSLGTALTRDIYVRAVTTAAAPTGAGTRAA